MKPLCNFLMGAILICGPANAAVWQWSVTVKSEKPEQGSARAFLWIPPDCRKVRGVVVAQHNMEEISILEHPAFRKALSDLNFAEVWVSPFFDHLFRFNRGAGETFDGMMNALAQQSGYGELMVAPVVPIGHSAAASWPYYFAAWNPERTLAALSVSGQWPYFRHKDWAPDIWGDRTMDFVPGLETMGEYESAGTWSREGLRERQEHPKMPLSMLSCPAEGHFASSDAKVAFLAFYLEKSVQYRVPRNWMVDAPPKLIPIDPTKTGWLAEKWRQDQAPSVAAAPVSEYKGDPRDAFWFFDEETVSAAKEYQARHRGLKPQLVGYAQDGKIVAQKDSHLQVDLKFQPESDGLTFRVSGAFYDAVPGGSPRLPIWTGLPVGSPIGHAHSGAISIDRICGPFEKRSADTFAIRFQKETTTNLNQYELVFAATHPGDAEYKAAVQQAHMFIPARNSQGVEQKITFPAIPDQKSGTESVTLAATSDANVTVYYYVREGPAEVDGSTLKFSKIPPGARFPVYVTVVAWQYGRSVEPKLKTAVSVERTFGIVK